MDATLTAVQAELDEAKAAVAELLATEMGASKAREAASKAAYLELIDGVTQQSNTIRSELTDMKDGLVTSMGELQSGLKTDIATLQSKVDVDVAKSTAKLTDDAAALAAKVDASVKCSASGGNMVLVGDDCLPVTGTLKTVDCDAARVGATQYNVKLRVLQLCMKAGPSYVFIYPGVRVVGVATQHVLPTQCRVMGAESWVP